MVQGNDTRPGPNPSGLCLCGCGQATWIATINSARHGWVKGQPVRFVAGHHSRGKHRVGYTVEPETGCWIWNGATDGNGLYGVMGDRGKRYVAHRFFYERRHGPISDGLELDHCCPLGPNTLCVNPDHLEPVTPVVNTRRSRRAKLTIEQAREIRRLEGTMTHKAIGVLFGVSAGAIFSVLHNVTWIDDDV